MFELTTVDCIAIYILHYISSCFVIKVVFNIHVYIHLKQGKDFSERILIIIIEFAVYLAI